MTNLSKQLCEICGIKPRYGVYQNFGDLDNDYRLVTNVRKYRLIADTRFRVDDEDLRNLKPIYYPDFEQPENFAKLFELITTIEDFTYSTGLYYIPQIPSHKQLSRLATSEGEYESESIYAIKAFLTCVVKCVAKEKDTANFIKQTEWVYD